MNPIAAPYNPFSEAGRFSRTNVTSALQVYQRRGRLCRLSVVTASSADGYVDDVQSGTTDVSTLIFKVPANTAAGTLYEIMAPINYGLLLSPGAGGNWAVSFD